MKISHRIGWNLTDLHGQLQVPHWNNEEGEEEDANRNGGGQLLIFNAEDHEMRDKPPLYYWKAPKPFLGNRLNSFGANLHYYVYYVPKEPSKGHSTPIADVILEVGVKLGN